MVRLGAAAREEIDTALRAASSAAAAEVAREGPGALRPHEILLLLLPMESRMLLPAPLRSLVSSAPQAPLSVLYAEEGDARLASLKAAVRAANVEVNAHRAQMMAEPAYAAARAMSLTGKVRLFYLPVTFGTNPANNLTCPPQKYNLH